MNQRPPKPKVTDATLDSLRVPPHSIEAEQSVLGGLLLDNQAWDRMGDLVTDTDFYRDEHRRIFRQIRNLLERAKPADVVTVAEALDGAGEGEQTGGLAYLGELAANTPSAANIKRYAEIVRERAVLRQLVATADEIAADALNPLGRDAETLLDEAESKIFKIAEAGAGHNEGFVHINPLLTQVVERIQELHDRENPSDITGVPTGFLDLDQKTSGFQPGDLIIVAGRPSMGKTAFALNIAENVAVDSGLPVGVFSMEMGGAQLATRMLASIGRLNSQSLRTGRMSDDEWSKLSIAHNGSNKQQRGSPCSTKKSPTSRCQPPAANPSTWPIRRAKRSSSISTPRTARRAAPLRARTFATCMTSSQPPTPSCWAFHETA